MIATRRLRALAPAALALLLGVGWASREVAFARERAAMVESKTVALDQVKMEAPATYEGKRRGRAKRVSTSQATRPPAPSSSPAASSSTPARRPTSRTRTSRRRS